MSAFRVPSFNRSRVAITVAAAFAVVALNGCVVAPPRTVAVAGPPPQRVYVYPSAGQSAEQTDRDRYECHLWAVQQSGVDPSRADASTYEHVLVEAPPPGTNTAAGAVGGAILGAMLAGPRNAAAGLILGGATGAVVGSTADAAVQQQAHQTQAQIDQSASVGRARADSYRHALTACLQGRGYTVN